MDGEEPRAIRPEQVAISERSHRRGMQACRTIDSIRQACRNRRRIDVREVMSAIMYILSTGCQWRALPKDLPPRSTVHEYLGRWIYDGTLDRIHHLLYLEVPRAGGTRRRSSAAIIDSQSVKSAEKGGAHIDSQGYDAAKKIKGKKRHILSTPPDCCSTLLRTAPISKIVTAAFCSFRPRSGRFHF